MTGEERQKLLEEYDYVIFHLKWLSVGAVVGFGICWVAVISLIIYAIFF